MFQKHKQVHLCTELDSMNNINLCSYINILRPEQNDHFAEGTFKCILLNENVCILLQISLKFLPKGQFANKSALV